MDRQKIRQVVREHLPEIRKCYETELKTNPNLFGKLVVEWDIDETGNVSATKAKHPLAPSLDACIMAAIKTWHFESPPKNMIGRVDYPFVFSKDSGPPKN